MFPNNNHEEGVEPESGNPFGCCPGMEDSLRVIPRKV